MMEPSKLSSSFIDRMLHDLREERDRAFDRMKVSRMTGDAAGHEYFSGQYFAYSQVIEWVLAQ